MSDFGMTLFEGVMSVVEFFAPAVCIFLFIVMIGCFIYILMVFFNFFK